MSSCGFFRKLWQTLGSAALRAGDGPRVSCRATLQGNLIPKGCVPNQAVLCAQKGSARRLRTPEILSQAKDKSCQLA